MADQQSSDRERAREASRRYRERNREKLRARALADRATAQGSARALDRERRYRERNRQKIRARIAAYRATPEGRAQRAEYMQRPEVRAALRDYWKTPEFKAAARAYRRTPWGRYVAHKHNAKKRGVPFLLTFEQWLSIWLESGHFEERGRAADRYSMCRCGDVGPYAVGNVYIATAAQNRKDATLNRKQRGGATPHINR